MSELKATTVYDAYWKANSVGEGTGILVYLKSEADKVISDLEESHKMEVEQLLIEIVELKEERRWRKFSEEKPSEEMEGEDFIVSNGFYSVVCEWRGYWNNEPFCGDRNYDEVKYWMPLPKKPKEAK